VTLSLALQLRSGADSDQIWRCHYKQRLARRRNLDRSSAQRPEIASLSLTRKKEWFEPTIACESAIFHRGRVGRPAGEELAMTVVAGDPT
jgi:hypothetical protein